MNAVRRLVDWFNRLDGEPPPASGGSGKTRAKLRNASSHNAPAAAASDAVCTITLNREPLVGQAAVAAGPAATTAAPERVAAKKSWATASADDLRRAASDLPPPWAPQPPLPPPPQQQPQQQQLKARSLAPPATIPARRRGEAAVAAGAAAATARALAELPAAALEAIWAALDAPSRRAARAAAPRVFDVAVRRVTLRPGDLPAAGDLAARFPALSEVVLQLNVPAQHSQQPQSQHATNTTSSGGGADGAENETSAPGPASSSAAAAAPSADLEVVRLHGWARRAAGSLRVVHTLEGERPPPPFYCWQVLG